MKNNQKLLSIICGVLVMALTALIYGLTVENLFRESIKWLSVLFLLIAEFLLLIKVLFGKKDALMGAQFTVGAGYAGVVFILSLIFINIPSPGSKWFISIHAICFVALVLIDVLILNFDKNILASERQLAENQSIVYNCQFAIDEVIAANNGNEFEKELSEISEMIKYSDNSSLSGSEDLIMEKINILGEMFKDIEQNREVILEQINGIKALVRSRSNYIRQSKRGTF